MKKKILILGSEGQIGGHLFDYLQKEKDNPGSTEPSSERDDNTWTTVYAGEASFCTIIFLQPFTYNWVRVRGINQFGDGQWSQKPSLVFTTMLNEMQVLTPVDCFGSAGRCACDVCRVSELIHEIYV